MKNKRISIFVLIISVLLLISACQPDSSESNNADITRSEQEMPEQETPPDIAEARLVPDLPDMDFGGLEIRGCIQGIDKIRIRW